MTVAAVVWDWNGTLLDDVTAALRSINVVLDEFSLPRLADEAAYRDVFGFPIAGYYQRIGFDTSPGGTFDAAAHRFIEVYAHESRTATLHPGALETLAALHQAGVRQVVISATEHGRLQAQMAPYDIERWLDDALGIEDIYARSKLHIAEHWLSEIGLDPATVLFVGDSLHDHEIATALGAPCVLYSQGHHAREQLTALGAPVVDDLRDVLPLVVPQVISFDPRYRDWVLAGSKTRTTRYGDQPELGRSLFRFETDPPTYEAGDVTELRTTRLEDLTDADAAAENFATADELRAALRYHYPGIPDDAEVTVATFRLNPRAHSTS